jgi:hypothetical protein
VLHNNGVTPAAIATALATGYIHYVTTICVAMNIPREQVLDHAVAAIRQLDKYADEVFTKCLAEKEKFDNEQQ